MSFSSFTRFVASFVVSLLAACGGSDEPTLEGCAGQVHRTDRVIYVVGDCETATLGGVPLQQGVETAVGSMRLLLVRPGTWRMFPNEDSWAARDGAGLLFFKGELYLLGGWVYGPTSNEVWKTSDLHEWIFVGNAPWLPRHGAAWLVHDGRMFVIGGDLIDDVWSSPDGVEWTLEAANAPFGRRYTPNAASIGGQIVVYGGQGWDPVDWCVYQPDCRPVGFQDVWRSRDGRAWERLADGPWQGRGLVHGSLVHQGEIFLVGGGLKAPPPNARYAETWAEYNDVWSSPDGTRWTRRGSMRYPRTHFSVVATPGGCFMSDGSVGTQANLSNDLFFASDCIDFAPVAVPPGHAGPARQFARLVQWVDRRAGRAGRVGYQRLAILPVAPPFTRRGGPAPRSRCTSRAHCFR